ncbi:MAG: cytochrome b N-terminal domain-containing protein [Fimbriimonadales bacterium]
MATKSLGRVGPLLGGAWLLVGLQVILGVVLATKYTPTLEGAHASVAALERTAGWGFFAAFHYWASAILILSLAAGAAVMLFGGHVRRETKWVWWSLLALLGLVIAVQVTGNALPASQHDVRTVNIEAGIAGGVPSAGPAIRAAVLGGDQFAQATVDRWYSLHRFILPLLILVATLSGMLAARKAGVKISLLAACVPAVLALVLAAAFGLPLGPAAGADDYGSTGANPMWYVYPNHAMLVAIGKASPALQWVGAILLPAVGGLFLAVLPLLSKDGKMGRWVGAVGAVGVLAVCLTAGSPVQSPFAEKAETVDSGDYGPIDGAMAVKGEGVFLRENCLSCHKLGEKGSSMVGPNLAGVGSRHGDPAWYQQLLKDPASKNRSTMPAFDDLSETDSRAIAEYLRSL